MYLFVYGTLKTNEQNNYLLRGKFLRQTRTVPKYKLIDCGAFPGLADGTFSVEGELWEIDPNTLKFLDKFEGVDCGMYSREQVELEDGTLAIAYICLLLDKPDYNGTNWTS